MDSFERLSDEELLTMTSRRPEAFGAFYRRHEKPMLVFFLRRVATPELGADLTAEVFAAGLRRVSVAAAGCARRSRPPSSSPPGRRPPASCRLPAVRRRAAPSVSKPTPRPQEPTDVMTEPKAGLPGRFFAVVVPDLGRIEVVGYDGAEQERARIGSRARPVHPPRSKAEAIAHGDPAGFAPTVPTPTSYIYKGKSITEAEATRMQLACVQGRERFRCYDSAPHVEGSHRPRASGR